MIKTVVRSLGLLLIVLLVVVLAMGAKLQGYLDTPLNISEQGFHYSLKKGGTLSGVAYELAQQDVLQSPRWLLFYVRLANRGHFIEAGDYLLERGITPRQLLTKLEQGDVQLFQLTLVEGWNLRQVLDLLHTIPRIQTSTALNADTMDAQKLGVEKSYLSLEGLFFPDTYSYHSGTTNIELLRRAYDRMQTVLLEEWQLRAKDLPYSSPYEALIMASLIEKETGVAHERQQIAGVFVRRLQKRMRLQTDPATIFGLGKDFDGNLRSHHLKDAGNPYNTYRHHGLTPTPIALAGREAIHAALHPAEGETLYFVAKGDGSHYFSVTLEEHQKAVRKYQITQRRKNYSSSPLTKQPD